MLQSFQQDPCIADGEGRGAEFFSNSDSLGECPRLAFQNGCVHIESGDQVVSGSTAPAKAALDLGRRQPGLSGDTRTMDGGAERDIL